MRDCEITTVESSVASDSPWQGIHPNKTIKAVTACEFELGEEVIGFVQYTDGTFEVGIGESLRPYDRIYTGASEVMARMRFWETVTKHVEG